MMEISEHNNEPPASTPLPAAVYIAQKEGAKMELFARKAELSVRAEELRGQLKKSQVGDFREEARHRKAVLRRLGHIDDSDVVQLKVGGSRRGGGNGWGT